MAMVWSFMIGAVHWMTVSIAGLVIAGAARLGTAGAAGGEAIVAE